jgi:hypothetical protein
MKEIMFAKCVLKKKLIVSKSLVRTYFKVDATYQGPSIVVWRKTSCAIITQPKALRNATIYSSMIGLISTYI